MQTSFYPMEFVERGAVKPHHPDDIEEGTVQYLAETLGIHQAGIATGSWCAHRTPTRAEFFRLPPDGRTSIIQISRTAFDGNGQPMRVTVTVYPADRNQLIVDFGQVPEQETGAGDLGESRASPSRSMELTSRGGTVPDLQNLPAASGAKMYHGQPAKEPTDV